MRLTTGSSSKLLLLHATENKRVQAPSVGPDRLVLYCFALCAVSSLRAHSQTQAWIPACFEHSRSASKSSENAIIAAIRHMLYSIGWHFSQGKVCTCGNILLRYVSVRNPINLGACGRVCVVIGLRRHHAVVVRPTMHLARLSYPMFIRIWPCSRIACCGCHDSVVEHWLYRVLYRNSSVVHDLKYMQTCANSVTHSFDKRLVPMILVHITSNNFDYCYQFRHVPPGLQLLQTPKAAMIADASCCVVLNAVRSINSRTALVFEFYRVFHDPESIGKCIRYLRFTDRWGRSCIVKMWKLLCSFVEGSHCQFDVQLLELDVTLLHIGFPG